MEALFREHQLQFSIVLSDQISEIMLANPCPSFLRNNFDKVCNGEGDRKLRIELVNYDRHLVCQENNHVCERWAKE